MITKEKKRVAVHVVPAGDQWEVKFETNDRSLSRYENKPEAISVAIETAKRCQPSQVKIHRQDGTFQEERTYGDDPYPPAG